MMRRSARADMARIAHVLADVPFPAAKWQLIIHAEDYGADATSRADLWRLPAALYPDLAAVHVALGLVAAPPRAGYRPAPPAQAAGRDTR
jgi:hypothetical protein